MAVCFVDLDGVLADFVGAVCRVFGVTREQLYARWPVGEFDMDHALGLTPDEFWAGITKDPAFWFTMEPMQSHGEILSIAERYFGKNVAILTSPPKDPAAAAGKMAWIQKHLPDYSRRFFIGPPKQLLAHAGAVLVDDYDKNVDAFKAAGGHAVLLPRRWNSAYMELSANAVLELGLRAAKQRMP